MSNLAKESQVKITLAADLEVKIRKDITNNLSGVVLSHDGKYLWLGTDEFSALERLERLDGNEHTFGNHKRFYFRDFVDDFDEDKGEVDIEGLDYDNGYLWAIGSHSSKRKKVQVEADKLKVEKKELKDIERQENRYLLVRVPVNQAGNIDVNSSMRAWLKRGKGSDSLTQALAEDEYLNISKILKNDDESILPGKEFYFYLPSKENGFDIEGLAVHGNKIFIGLRGPVLRGIAILLEIEVEESSHNTLSLKPIGSNNRLYKRHFLDLGGLGLRELCWDKSGDDLLVLAGPTMDLDGAHSLYKLRNPIALEDNSLSCIKNQQLLQIGDIPHGHHSDRAEGLTLYGDKDSILVVYDSPVSHRLIQDANQSNVGVYGDLFGIN